MSLPSKQPKQVHGQSGKPPSKRSSFFPVINNLRRSDKVLGILLLLAWVTILLGYFWPSRNRFDGNLLVEEMSFTYSGPEERLFLNTIPNLAQLDLQGSQPQPIILRGQFSSADPELNQKLKKLAGKLTVQLPYAASRLIVDVANRKQPSDLSLNYLRLEPETMVNQLSYDAKLPQLSSCLLTSGIKLEACLYPANFFKAPIPADSPPVGKLSLLLGQQPLKVTLVNVDSRELGKGQDLSFQFVPAEDYSAEEVVLTLLAPTRLLLDLPNLKSAKPKEVNEWFWGSMEVRNVRFSRIVRNPSNVADVFSLSTVIAGKLRIGNQVLDLQSDQFLYIPPSEPGIDVLSSIRINLTAPEGIRTSFSGVSKSVGFGFLEGSPVQKITPNWLSKFPQEAINSVLAFIGALTGFMLPRLLPDDDAE